MDNNGDQNTNMSDPNQGRQRKGAPTNHHPNVSGSGYDFGSDLNFSRIQGHDSAPANGRSNPEDEIPSNDFGDQNNAYNAHRQAASSPMKVQNQLPSFPPGQLRFPGPQSGLTMPAGFDQLMRFPRPPQGPPRFPPTLTRNQNLRGGQPNTPRPTQSQPSPHSQIRQPLTPGISNSAPQSTSVPNQRTSAAPDISKYECGGEYFQNIGQVKAYIQELAWMPSMGTYGIPQTVAERKYYLDVLKAVIPSTADVWDKKTSPVDFAKSTQFLVGGEVLNGEWTGPKDIEAAAIFILTSTINMHARGVHGLRFLRSGDYTYHYNEDVDFTFTQRIHFVAWLLEHSKVAAALVMAFQNIDKFLAIPFTTLMTFQNFADEWTGLSDEDKHQFMNVIPYQKVEVKHPTEQQQADLRKRSQALFREMKARGAGFPDAKSKAEFDAREAAAGRSLFGGQSAASSMGQSQGQSDPGLAFGTLATGGRIQMPHRMEDGESQGQTVFQNSNSPHLGSNARPRNASMQYGGSSPEPRGPSNQTQQYSRGPPGFQGQPGQLGNLGGDGQGEEDEL